ncbi:response regulator [Nanchangia anserum]|uniref:Response regulator n=1 Tax=Nanchangia anserum TaxID=2692125 RepID=A0A8I0KN38_9ACTO|nr:response regulator [Nanchangia anserum]MBD3688866.1 response regulator [Nanchangia anserum]QOX81136.1 response regulator [Nanchangia anserum]
MNLAVIILEDEPEVRHALLRDLDPFASLIRIEPAEDVDDAWDVVEEVDADGDVVAVVMADHRMPGKTGVDFLVEMQDDERTVDARTVLVTGQADLADTIRALNEASLDHYITKPWDPEDLRSTLRDQLTEYVLRTDLEPLRYLKVLDSQRVLDHMRGAD